MARILIPLLASSAILSRAIAQNDAINSLTSQMSEPSCSMNGSKLVCSNILSMVEDMEGNPVFISSSVSCESSPSMFDFRKAEGCTCTAEVTAGSETKTCGCTVCPAGYGINPLSVDCGDLENPYVLDTCTKLDCNFDCDGACIGGCDVDPLPAECVSLCTRESDVELPEATSDAPSDVPSDRPSDIPSDMPSDMPSAEGSGEGTGSTPTTEPPVDPSPFADPTISSGSWRIGSTMALALSVFSTFC